MTNYGLGDWIHRHRIKSAGRIAVTAGNLELTYQQFGERINRLANALTDRGVNRGDRVAYLGENSRAFLETLFALGSIGAVFVPLNTRLAAPEVAFHLEDAGAQMLIASQAMEPLAIAGIRGTAIERLIFVDDGAHEPARGEQPDIPMEQYAAVLDSASADRPNVKRWYRRFGHYSYTSGTTGNPKGAMLSHGNLTWNALSMWSPIWN